MTAIKTSFPYYQVKDGDNLKTIAQKSGVDPIKILLDNKISPKQIHAGMLLKIKK